MSSAVPAIGVAGLSKRFGAVRALDDVSLAIESGGVHAIVGENGAGKTTFLNVLAGLVRPDKGSISLDGAPYAPRRPKDAARRGIGLVHQHFMLVPTLTALENAMLGSEATRAGFALDRAAARARFRETASRFALDVDPEARVESMSVGEMQRLEILKVLLEGTRLLLLDEPTAVLTPHEAQALYETVGALSREGATVVLITHRLREVVQHARDVVVMRRGRVVARIEVASTTEAELARLLVGREPAAFDSGSRSTPGPCAVQLRGVKDSARRGSRSRLQGIDLEVRAGEILGLAGIEGNGQRELAEVIAGLQPFTGALTLGGVSVQGRSPAAIRRLGLAHVPGDRRQEGVVPAMSAAENILLGRQRERRFSRPLGLRRREVRAFAAERLARFDVVPSDPDAPLRSFSGGNQQKLVFARESEGAPRCLLASHPTRGVDVAAQEKIHETLLSLRESGCAILLVSSDLLEILRLSDRIAVLVRGAIRVTYSRGEVDEEGLGLAMTGGPPSASSGS